MLNLGKESEEIEFKKSTSEIKEALRSICAMLNKSGKGVVYFGVKDNGDGIGQIVGKETKRDIERAIEQYIKPSIFPVIENLKENNNIIYVKFSGNEKPYSCDGRFYIRVSDIDKVLEAHEMVSFLNSNNIRVSNYEEEDSKETINDIDDSLLYSYYEKCIKSNRLLNVPYNKEEFLKKLNLLNDKYLNNAGQLLFSKNKPIVLKLAIFPSDEKLSFIDNQLVEGNIFELIDYSLSYIKRNINYRGEIKGTKRIDTPEIPIEALREIIVNSFVHSSFDRRVQHAIYITPTRISIFNSGTFPSKYDPYDFAYKECKSILRNPLIAKTLYYSSDIESRASGFRRVFNLCKEQNIKTNYISKNMGFEFIFYRKKMSESPLKERLYNVLKNDNSLTGEELSSILNVSRKTIQTLLKELKEEGKIERIGSNKTGYYKIK